jgi:hypothetical protein
MNMNISIRPNIMNYINIITKRDGFGGGRR